MNNGFSLKQLAVLAGACASFEEFQKAVIVANDEHETNAQIAEIESLEAEKAAQTEIDEFDPSSITALEAAQMGFTNGMPVCLMKQKYDAWKASQAVV